MDKTRKLGAVLSDDELFKQKALEYFTAADKSGSGTLSDEEVLEVWRAPKHCPKQSAPEPPMHASTMHTDPDTLPALPCQLCRKISEQRSWFETQRSPAVWHSTLHGQTGITLRAQGAPSRPGAQPRSGGVVQPVSERL